MEQMFNFTQFGQNALSPEVSLAQSPISEHVFSSFTATSLASRESQASLFGTSANGGLENLGDSSQAHESLLKNLLENVTINDHANHKTLYLDGPSCTCDDGVPASAYCTTCKDYLCDRCVSAHNRVKLTKDHAIERLANKTSAIDFSAYSMPTEQRADASLLPAQMSRKLFPGETQRSCSEHSRGQLHLYCELCSMAICNKCAVLNHSGHNIKYLQQIIDGSKTALVSLISQSKVQIDILETLSARVLSTLDSLELHSSSICADIRAVFRKLTQLLEQRENDLITNVQKIRQVKVEVLRGQMNNIMQQSKGLKLLTEEIKKNFESGSDLDILEAKSALKEELARVDQQIISNAVPHENECVSFCPPDPSIQLSLAALGNITSGASALFSKVSGNGAKNPVCSITNQFEIAAHNHLGEVCMKGGDMVQVEIKDSDGNMVQHKLLDKQNGTYVVEYQPVQEGHHMIKVTIQGKEIMGSPFQAYVQGKQPSFSGRATPRLVFGGTGDKDGQLCRPWGIACDPSGNFVVADRSNNRIQIFSPTGEFVRKFGTPGSYPGQFNRPAGVSVDPLGRIIVADKDNHRIQIFSFEGKFILVFGERGSKNGQFYYPWDVATNSKGAIAVTDTRNHRIQLFEPGGRFIGKYGFEGILWKHFDSPRGISFTPGNANIVVTDFNNHRLVIVQPDLQSARFLGSEGTQPSQFLRPQGVIVDKDGNYIVADSRNHRLQVFSSSGTIIAILGGTQGSGSNEMDRPSGVAVTPGSGIAVVDFGNNRVLVY